MIKESDPTPKWLKVKAVGTHRAFEPIVDQIRQAIYADDLKPGDKLPTERELSEIFQASRISVRNAVLSLEQAGLLEIKKGATGGFFVRELDDRAFRDSLTDLIKTKKASIHDLSEARSIIEPQAAALAAQRAEPGDILGIERTINDFRLRTQQQASPEPSDLDFHESIAQASHNLVIHFLTRALKTLLYQSIDSYTLPQEDNRQIIEDHSLVLEAIKSQDSEKAYNRMLKHVKGMQDMFSTLEGGPPPGSDVPRHRGSGTAKYKNSKESS